VGLKEYNTKRDFSRTAEPSGGKARLLRKAKDLLFVVQKHDATRLHYDFRLEMEGVLKSWAVPKGFPWKKGDRRLAVQVEDHPFDYRNFEGIIPEGNYGAGTVMVWDTGTYTVGGDDPMRALQEGKLHLFLSGRKLRHEWTLVRLRSRASEEKPQWLLLKSGESVEPLSAREDNRSAVSGRSMEEIARSADRKWESNRPRRTQDRNKGADRRSDGRVKRVATRKPFSPSGLDLGSLPAAVPAFLEPMKARIARQLPTGADWVSEIKFDGIRAIAVKDGKTVRLYSRAGNDLTVKFTAVATALTLVPAKQAVLDGEIAALDREGRSSFQLLQSYHMAPSPKPPLVFYAFDIPNLEGRSLTDLPLLQRKNILQSLLEGDNGVVRFSPALDANPERVAAEMRSRGLEGLIAKRKDSIYEAGRRSGAWLKYKWVAEQEFVIGGYTDPKGSRSHFGALLVGYYDGPKLLFCGKVGTGFDEKTLKDLDRRFKPFVQVDCPFSNLPERRISSRGGGLTASQMRLCTWIKPHFVAQVKFAEWTRDGHLRQPCFVGMREDKAAHEVIRET
jgi:bifunctional non-homologous end joining protein LigD